MQYAKVIGLYEPYGDGWDTCLEVETIGSKAEVEDRGYSRRWGLNQNSLTIHRIEYAEFLGLSHDEFNQWYDKLIEANIRKGKPIPQDILDKIEEI